MKLRINTKLVVMLLAWLFVASTAARATSLNLTTAGSSGSLTAFDFFATTEVQPIGAGVIQSFVRISTNQGIVQGYNTDARPLQFDENNSGTFTRALQLGFVPIVSLGGVNYRQFTLDINQQSSNPLLSLNELQIFIGNTGNPIGATVGAGGTLNFGGQASIIYDLDSNGDNTIELDYNLNSGSGSGDMFAYIRSDLFGADNTKFVTLYSRFGSPNPNNDGYEEWAVRSPGTIPTPEPSTITTLLCGLALTGYERLRRLRRS